MKKYMTSDDLIEYLIKKGVTISNKSRFKNIIKKYSYYSIINTYKNVFKDDDGVYVKNVKFEEIYSLYLFDKELRILLLKHLLNFEIIMKTFISEQLSEKYGIYKYLKSKNFDKSIDSSVINSDIKQFENEIKKQYGKHDAITHYSDKYQFIPPYVLMKVLTYGEISKFYSIMKQEDRQEISKRFKMSDKSLKQFLKVTTLVRNICAHNERLFDFNSKFIISFKGINININKNGSTNLYIIIKMLKYVLTKEEYEELEKDIYEQLYHLRKNIKSISIDKILDKMGFFDLKLNSIN